MARRIGRAARVLFGYLRFIKEGVIVCYCINCILMSLFPHRGSMRCVSDCVDTLLASANPRLSIFKAIKAQCYCYSQCN